MFPNSMNNPDILRTGKSVGESKSLISLGPRPVKKMMKGKQQVELQKFEQIL